MGRRIRIYTGAGGVDLFEEALEEAVGLKRIYVGNKVPRILRILKIPIKESRAGRYYKLIGKMKIPEELSLEYPISNYGFTSYRIAP